MGFGKSTLTATKEKALKALEEFLRPEFLARVDETIVFSHLSAEALKDIAKLSLDLLAENLKEKQIIFNYDNAVCEYFADSCNSIKRGARDLKSNIRKLVEDVIIEEMINNSEKQLLSINLSYDNELKILYKYK